MDELNIILGFNAENDPIYIDISTLPHMLIGGTTQSGKSVLLKSIIYQVGCGVVLIDKKNQDFNIFTGSKKIYNNKVFTTETEITHALLWLKNQMEKRTEIFNKYNANNLQDYNIKTGDTIKPILVIFDEFGEISTENNKLLKELIRKARSSGIHFILATQTPRHDIIDGTIKANLSFKIALKTSSALESRIITGYNTCKADLLPQSKGYFYYWDGQKLDQKNKPDFTLARSVYIDNDTITKAIKENKL